MDIRRSSGVVCQFTEVFDAASTLQLIQAIERLHQCHDIDRTIGFALQRHDAEDNLMLGTVEILGQQYIRQIVPFGIV